MVAVVMVAVVVVVKVLSDSFVVVVGLTGGFEWWTSVVDLSSGLV